MDEDRKRRKFLPIIIITIIVSLIIVIFSGLIAGVIDTKLQEPVTFKFIINHFLSGLGFKIFIVLLVLYFFALIYFCVKFNMFSSSKLLNRVDKADSNIYGSNRWMTRFEMTKNFGEKKNGKYSDYKFTELANSDFSGYIINSYIKKDELYCQAVKEKHAIVIGATGSGKTQYFLLPTIEANAKSKIKPSMIINDMKGELFEKSSLCLKQNGYNVKVINLRTPESSQRFNPLSLIYDTYQKYLEDKTKNYFMLDKVSNFISSIASSIVPILPGEGMSWSQGAQSILKGIIWAMLEDTGRLGMTKERFTLSNVSKLINDDRKYLNDFLKDRESSIVPTLTSLITDNASAQNSASYMSSLQQPMAQIINFGFSYLTSYSDWNLEELLDKPTVVFLIIPDNEKEKWPLATMIISQIYSYLIFRASQLEGNTLPKPFYFLLDEFSNMPTWEDYPIATTIARSRNVFLCAIVQDFEMLQKKYGEHEKNTIIQNSHLKLYLRSSENNTLKYFQELLATTTIYSRTSQINQQTLTNMEYQGSTSLAQHNLIAINELQQIAQGKNIFIVDGCYPCKGSMIPFHDTKMQDKKIFIKGKLKEEFINNNNYCESENAKFKLVIRQQVKTTEPENVTYADVLAREDKMQSQIQKAIDKEKALQEKTKAFNENRPQSPRRLQKQRPQKITEERAEALEKEEIEEIKISTEVEKRTKEEIEDAVGFKISEEENIVKMETLFEETLHLMRNSEEKGEAS